MFLKRAVRKTLARERGHLSHLLRGNGGGLDLKGSVTGNRRGGGAADHHRNIKHNYALQRTDRGVEAHGVIMHATEAGGNYDGLDLSNLAPDEIVSRHAQLAECVYMQEPAGAAAGEKQGKGGGQAGFVDDADVLIGNHRRTGEALIALDLLDYVAKEVKQEAGVMKQVREASTERRLLAKECGSAAADK